MVADPRTAEIRIGDVEVAVQPGALKLKETDPVAVKERDVCRRRTKRAEGGGRVQFAVDFKHPVAVVLYDFRDHGRPLLFYSYFIKYNCFCQYFLLC